jgi:hypothetical protein
MRSSGRRSVALVSTTHGPRASLPGGVLAFDDTDGLRPAALPWDREPPLELEFVCAHKPFALTAAESAELREFARRESSSLFMVMLACLQVLLARTTGGDDVAVGVPAVNRKHEQTHGVVGYFANTTVVRTHLAGSPTFRDVLARVRKGVLGALAHQLFAVAAVSSGRRARTRPSTPTQLAKPDQRPTVPRAIQFPPAGQGQPVGRDEAAAAADQPRSQHVRLRAVDGGRRALVRQV